MASRPPLGPTQPPIQCVTGVERPGRGVVHSGPSSAEAEDGGAMPPLSLCHTVALGHSSKRTLTTCFVQPKHRLVLPAMHLRVLPRAENTRQVLRWSFWARFESYPSQSFVLITPVNFNLSVVLSRRCSSRWGRPVACFVRFEVFTVVTMKKAVFWDVVLTDFRRNVSPPSSG
jgi:hypothetical protein